MWKRELMAVLLAASVMSASPVFAHAKLQSSSPAADAVMPAAPSSLTLNFDEDVRLAALKLTLGGEDIPLSFDRAAAAAPTVRVALPKLAAGKYKVQWSALSPDDGHVAKGTFFFVIKG